MFSTLNDIKDMYQFGELESDSIRNKSTGNGESPVRKVSALTVSLAQEGESGLPRWLPLSEQSQSELR